MKNSKKHPYLRSLFWFVLSGFFLAGLGVASIVDRKEIRLVSPFKKDISSTELLQELEDLGLLKNAPQRGVEKLLLHQKKTNQPLVKLLKEKKWQTELGLHSNRFKSTWYAANPFDLLPPDLQLAIRQKKIPMTSPKRVMEWCRVKKAPQIWVTALQTAFCETTPENLYRAALGKRPYAKNGQLLEPLVEEKKNGTYIVRSGHIATDPTIIPTNSYVVLIIRLNGKDKLLRVKATDIGQAIKGYHVDLPIQFKPRVEMKHSPYIYFPKDRIGNATVMILSTRKFPNPSS